LKKVTILILLSSFFAFAASETNAAFESFDINGGAEENSVLYSTIKDEEPGKNAKSFFRKTILANKKNYLIAKKVLAEKGVPESFLWVAMTESKFENSTAIKRTRTAGIWQMVPGTSRTFGLKVGKGLDERKDVEKCTAAFADYCQYMHKRFKNWGLVAVGYNCGDDRLRRVMKKTGTTDLNVLLDPNKKLLPKETRIYFKRVVTLAKTANNGEIEDFLENIEKENGE
jgi:membrane-bound lytic murein transglycosylase D